MLRGSKLTRIAKNDWIPTRPDCETLMTEFLGFLYTGAAQKRSFADERIDAPVGGDVAAGEIEPAKLDVSGVCQL
jgi:hypothetical protein